MDYFPNKYTINIGSLPAIVIGGTPSRIYGPAQPGTVAATIVTASGNLVVTKIRIVNTTASAATITMSIGVDAAATRIYSATSIPANGVFDDPVNIPLAGAEIIQAFQGTLNALTVTISANIL